MSKDKKTHWKQNFNYNYLGAYSLENGEDKILTIKEILKEVVTSANGRKEECTICYFSDSEKPMILNKTNCKSISKIYGSPYIEDWIGNKIQIYVKNNVRFGSDTVEALRVREFIPQTKLPNLKKEEYDNCFNCLASNGNLDAIKAHRNISTKQEKEILKLYETS